MYLKIFIYFFQTIIYLARYVHDYNCNLALLAKIKPDRVLTELEK